MQAGSERGRHVSLVGGGEEREKQLPGKGATRVYGFAGGGGGVSGGEGFFCIGREEPERGEGGGGFFVKKKVVAVKVGRKGAKGKGGRCVRGKKKLPCLRNRRSCKELERRGGRDKERAAGKGEGGGTQERVLNEITGKMEGSSFWKELWGGRGRGEEEGGPERWRDGEGKHGIHRCGDSFGEGVFGGRESFRELGVAGLGAQVPCKCGGGVESGGSTGKGWGGFFEGSVEGGG